MVCGILLLVLIVGLRQTQAHGRVRYRDCLCNSGDIFNLGISLGLTPLGEQLGGNVVSSFAAIEPWASEGFVDPMFASSNLGKALAILFGFILGYGATLAEPALNALGATVEKIAVGAFKKACSCRQLPLGAIELHWVAKIAFNLDLWYLLVPLHDSHVNHFLQKTLLTLVGMCWRNHRTNYGSSGSCHGVGNWLKTGAIDGFGVLALASIGPIITVLTVGLIVENRNG